MALYHEMTPALAKKLLNNKNVYLTKEGRRLLQQIVKESKK
jgi:hypothetical protein